MISRERPEVANSSIAASGFGHHHLVEAEGRDHFHRGASDLLPSIRMKRSAVSARANENEKACVTMVSLREREAMELRNAYFGNMSCT